jgi:hypothetical protein
MAFYVISLKHTYHHNKFITLWCPEKADYCHAKELAGIYEEPKKGYCDSVKMSVECGKLEPFFELQDDFYHRIPNTKENRDMLGVRIKGGSLIKIDYPPFQKIKSAILGSDPNLSEDSDTYKVAFILLAGVTFGNNLSKIAKFTGYDKAFLHAVDANLRESEIWVKNKTQCNWEDDNAIQFWLDVAIGCGYLKREK